MIKLYKYSFVLFSFFMLTQKSEAMDYLLDLDKPRPKTILRKDVIDFSEDQILDLLEKSTALDKVKNSTIKNIDAESETLNINKKSILELEKNSKNKKGKNSGKYILSFPFSSSSLSFSALRLMSRCQNNICFIFLITCLC